jgi:ABC-type cobalt transport system substrate-binding protein
MKTEIIITLIIGLLIVCVGFAHNYGYSQGYSDSQLAEKIHQITKNYE